MKIGSYITMEINFLIKLQISLCVQDVLSITIVSVCVRVCV